MKALVVYKKGKEVERFYPGKRSNTVGRSPSCDIVVRSKGVKPVHFLLEWIGEGEFNDKLGFWTIIDISESHKGNRGGEGVVINEGKRNFGEFEFALIEDELAESKLKRGVLKRAVEANKELLEGQADGSTVLEVVYFRKDIDAVVNVKHLARTNVNIPAALFPTHPQLKFIWDQGSDKVGFIEDRGEQSAFDIVNRGEVVTDSVKSGDNKLRFEGHDFLVINTERVDYFLRLVPGVVVQADKFGWRRDPVVQSLAFTFIGLLGLYSFVTTHPLEVPEPPPPPRVAIVQIKAPPPPPPPPEPTPEPAQVKAEPPPPTPEPPKKIEQVKKETPAPEAKPAKITPDVKKNVTGLNVNAPEKSVNTMGLLGRLKPAAKTASTVSADQLLAQKAVSQTATGSTGFVVNKPPMGEVVDSNRARPNNAGLAAASTTLKTGKDVDMNAPALNIAGGRDKFAQGASLGKIATAGDASSGSTDDLAASMDVVGGLDKEAVRTALRENTRAIRNCYEKALFSNKDLAGRMSYYWKISPSGTVDGVQLIATDFSRVPLPAQNVENMPDFERCVGRVLQTIVFPRAPNGQATIVKYPFVFKGKR